MDYQNIGISGYQNTQGIQGFQQVLTTQMLERANQAVTPQERQKVADEFLAIFYKELLKQAITPSKLGLSEDPNSFMATFGSDLMAERVALELAQSRSFSAGDLFPSVVEGNTDIR